MDYSPPGSTVHGILQARILEWVVNFLLQGTFPTQGSNLCLLNGQVESRRKAFIKWGLSFYDLWSQQKHRVCVHFFVCMYAHICSKSCLASLGLISASVKGMMVVWVYSRSSSNACFIFCSFPARSPLPACRSHHAPKWHQCHPQRLRMAGLGVGQEPCPGSISLTHRAVGL